MSDGTNLAADVYLPPSKEKNQPCLLVRSPSGRRGQHVDLLAPMAKWGYVVVIQETRSAADPEGKTMPYLTDGWGVYHDGYDTVEWLAKSEWTNGKIATVGASALGITQLLMAPSAPPSLKCQYICKAAPCLYSYAIYSGGQLAKERVEGWLHYYAPDPSVLEFVKSRPDYDDFWSQFNTVGAAERVKTPSIHVGGWYDIFLQGTIDAFVARQERGGEGAHDQQKLVIGPWTHFWPQERR